MKQIINKILNQLSEFSTKEIVGYLFFAFLIPCTTFLKHRMLTGLKTEIPLYISMLPMLFLAAYFAIDLLIQTYKKPKIRYYESEMLYWKITIDKLTFNVQDIPYCPNHKITLCGNGLYGCPKCSKFDVQKYAIPMMHKRALSKIEHEISNNSKKLLTEKQFHKQIN